VFVAKEFVGQTKRRYAKRNENYFFLALQENECVKGFLATHTAIGRNADTTTFFFDAKENETQRNNFIIKAGKEVNNVETS
jgi:hypothetical protein